MSALGSAHNIISNIIVLLLSLFFCELIHELARSAHFTSGLETLDFDWANLRLGSVQVIFGGSHDADAPFGSIHHVNCTRSSSPKFLSALKQICLDGGLGHLDWLDCEFMVDCPLWPVLLLFTGQGHTFKVFLR